MSLPAVSVLAAVVLLVGCGAVAEGPGETTDAVIDVESSETTSKSDADGGGDVSSETAPVCAGDNMPCVAETPGRGNCCNGRHTCKVSDGGTEKRCNY